MSAAHDKHMAPFGEVLSDAKVAELLEELVVTALDDAPWEIEVVRWAAARLRETDAHREVSEKARAYRDAWMDGRTHDDAYHDLREAIDRAHPRGALGPEER